MLVQCPHCREIVAIDGLGRKPLNLPVKNVCDALQLYHSVGRAATAMGCSRAYIYKVIKEQNLSVKDFITQEHE